MQEIKLRSVTTIIADGKTQTVDTLGEMFDALHIPNTEQYTEARVSIVQHLLAFREVDLSPAYPGHSVKVFVEFEEG